MKILAAVAIGLMACVPRGSLEDVSKGVLLGGVLVFFANCLQFQFHAWRTRQPQHILLALCWLAFLILGLHDVWLIFKGWHPDSGWVALTAPIATLFTALLLGGRFAANTRDIEDFNLILHRRVSDARHELAQALAHASVLSLLKLLRDDLRQVIDYGSSTGAAPPATPTQWAAAIRHRYTGLFDELGMDSEWRIATQWPQPGVPPGTLQCMNLARIMEEALAKVIKHSQADWVQVSLGEDRPGVLALSIEDNGCGFDPRTLPAEGPNVGLRSMAARAARIGGQFEAGPRPEGGARVRVVLDRTEPASTGPGA